MHEIELIIFDCDGVLIDSEPIAARTLSASLTEAGLPTTALEVLVEFTGKSELELRRILASRGLQDVDAVFSAWHREIFAAFRGELRPMEGIEAVLRACDVAKCVASNSTVERLQKSLGRLDLCAYFAPNVFSAEMVAAPKPAPDLVELCLSRMGVERQHCLMIDDSPTGILAATAAGVCAIGFVAPSDPRPGRREALLAAGALDVAFGADELRLMLDRLVSARLPARRRVEA